MCTMLTDFVYIHFNEIYDHLQYKKIGQRQYSYSEKCVNKLYEYIKLFLSKIIFAIVEEPRQISKTLTKKHYQQVFLKIVLKYLFV